MDTVYLWLIAAIVLLIAEVITPGFVLACFSIGAFLALVPAVLELGLIWEIAAFSIGSLLALFLLRPFVRRISRNKQEIRTAADAFVGRRGRVTVEISATGKGRVAVDGDDFPARSAQPQLVIPQGATVEIIGRESIVLLVVPVEG